MVAIPFYHGESSANDGGRFTAKLITWMRARLIARCAGIVCSSEAERNELEKDFGRLVSTARMRVIRPAGSLGEMPEVSAEVALDATCWLDATRPHRVLAFGRLVESKRFDLVLQGCSKLACDWELVISGIGGNQRRIGVLAEELEIADRVQLTYLTDVELVSALNSASVAVSLSDEESFGMSMAEALSAGLRVVLSDIPAHRELAASAVDGAAVVLDSFDAAAVAAALESQSESGRIRPTVLPADAARYGDEVVDQVEDWVAARPESGQFRV